MNSINEFNFEYDKEFHYLCLKNCIRQLLDYSGVNDSRFFLNTVYMLAVDFNSNMQYGFQFIRGDRFSPVVLSKAHTLKTQNGLQAIRAWETNLKKIKTSPIIVVVDVFFLHYRNEYLKNHGAHCVILSGYDVDKKEVFIVDWYEPYFFKGAISLEMFIKARDSRNEYDNNPFSGFYTRNLWYELRAEDWDLNNNYNKYDALHENVYYSLHLQEYLMTNKIKGRVYGLDAWNAVCAFINDSLLKEDKEFWAFMHNSLFVLNTELNLFSMNIRILYDNHQIIHQELGILREVALAFNELLFMILKSSIRPSENIVQKTLQQMTTMSDVLKRLYDLFYRLNIWGTSQNKTEDRL